MDKENGDGGGSSKHKGSNSNSLQQGVDINDPNSLLNAASLFGKFQFLCLNIFQGASIRLFGSLTHNDS